MLSKRYSSELIAHKNRLILKQGNASRSSVSGHVATVFGCSGFLGRYLVNRLGQKGTQVVVPYRGDSERIRHLKPLGDLGQIVPMQFDPRNLANYEQAISTSDTVYNLIGKNYRTKNYSIEEANVETAKNIAELCKKYGTRLVHISHISADKDSNSEYLQMKYASEKEVHRIYPDATIVRLSTVFGHEDRFIRRFNWITINKVTPLPNHGNTVYRPVNVSDVATGLGHLLTKENVEGKLYEFYGPRALSFSKCLEMFNLTTYRHPFVLNAPKPFLKLVSEFMELVPFPLMSLDEVERLYIDETPVDENILQNLLDTPLKDLELSMVEFARRYRLHDVYGNVAPEQIRK
eukprot:NODE_140_length_16098_cov_0.678605.p5 type:complete len:348 gc:universal NODE_140_length_16098_cov_0.678605:10069-11112(+)